jgi:pimeloyl-ACP methyl ester carboxylesterase
VPFLSYITQQVIQYMSLQPSQSNTFYRHDGVFKEREEIMFSHKLLSYNNSKHHRTGSWESALEFPLLDIHPYVPILAHSRDLPIHLIWGDKDVIVEYNESLSAWKTELSSATSTCSLKVSIMKDAGHVVLAEYPDESVQLIQTFIESIQK